MGFNLKNLPKTVVSNDMAGKSMLVYGQSRTGKTSQACKFPKPLVLAFENGLRSIPGVTYMPITKWSEFVGILKELSNPANADYVRENFETLILDELSVACDMCSEYVCQTHGVNSIGEGNKGYGLWQELDAAFNKQIRILTHLPLTVVIIGHDGERTFKNELGEEYTKIYPAGIKRLVPFAVHACDIIAYLRPNGIAEDGREIPSSAIMVQTKEVYAGSRITYLPPFLPEFSAANMTAAIKEAVAMEEKQSGIKNTTYAEQVSIEAEGADSRIPFATMKEEIKAIALKLHANGRESEYRAIVDSYLGKGASVDAITDPVEQASKYQAVECVLHDLKNLNL